MREHGEVRFGGILAGARARGHARFERRSRRNAVDDKQRHALRGGQIAKQIPLPVREERPVHERGEAASNDRPRASQHVLVRFTGDVVRIEPAVLWRSAALLACSGVMAETSGICVALESRCGLAV